MRGTDNGHGLKAKLIKSGGISYAWTSSAFGLCFTAATVKNTIINIIEAMPRVEAQISTELYSRLKEYTARSRGTLYCQESEVVAEAIKEYLDRHERKVRRANA